MSLSGPRRLSPGSVIIIADNHDVEDVARDVAAEERIGAPHRLHLRLATRSVRRSGHKGIFVVAAGQVLQTSADQDGFCAIPRQGTVNGAPEERGIAQKPD